MTIFLLLKKSPRSCPKQTLVAPSISRSIDGMSPKYLNCTWFNVKLVHLWWTRKIVVQANSNFSPNAQNKLLIRNAGGPQKSWWKHSIRARSSIQLGFIVEQMHLGRFLSLCSWKAKRGHMPILLGVQPVETSGNAPFSQIQVQSNGISASHHNSMLQKCVN